MKKKDIIQLVKNIVKEGAYNDATLTTQGMPNSSRAVAPQDEYPFTAKPKSRLPGIMEDESTSFKVVNTDTGKTIDFGIDQAKAEEIVAAAKEDNINAKVVKMKNADDTGKLDEEGESWGLEPRQLADSFTFEELEQLYNDNKITKEDLNGATSYLQAWIDQHPTYLPQRDLTSPKRKAIRDKYLNEEEVHGKEIVITAGSLQNALTFIGDNLKKLSNSMLSRLLEILKISNISDFPYNVKDLKPKLKQMTPEEAKTFGLELNKFHTDMKRKNIKAEDVNVIDKLAPTGDSEKIKKSTGAGSSNSVKKAITVAKNSPDTTVTLVTKGVNEEEAPGTSMSNADIGTLNDLIQLYRPEKLKATIDILAKGTTLTSKFPKKYEEMDINEMINDYIKERGNDNLMEHVDKYHKRSQLMEGATEKLFALFNQGKTDAEVRSIYLTKNIDMPDSFISKLRNNWESLRKTKLDLTLADKEAEGFETIQQPKAIAGMEPGMEDGDVGMEEDKQLASGLFNETK